MKRILVLGVTALAAMLILFVSMPSGRAQQPTAGRGQQQPVESHAHGFDPADFDKTCKPCEDFFRFANGGWLTKNPIPAAYPSWGRDNVLADHNLDVLRQVLDEAAAKKNAAPGSVEQKIGDFYATCMDTAKIDAAGIHPLDSELERIAKISDIASLEAEAAHLQSFGANVMFDFGSTQDFRDSTEQTGEAFQGGLGLPDRDYYVKDDDASKKIRDAYRQHLIKMFSLMGDSGERPVAEADAVIKIETTLANASMTRTDLRDPEKIYHRMSTEDLQKLTPNFNWTAYFQDIGFPGVRVVNASQPDFLKALDGQIASVSLDDWKIYLHWHLVHVAAPRLSAPFVDENFNFFSRVLTGTTELRPRWKRCVNATDTALGEALGQKYVERAFPPAAKARALAMVHGLIDALREDLKTLPWMSPATRAQALVKLNAITLKIGYPDKWRDYSAMAVDRDSYVINAFRAAHFEFHRDLAKIGQPVDRAEWGMSPPTVNAYYNPQLNEIVFPAGILQPPFFDAQADDALNYGAMGAIIGHEMTHGFDDEGRQFDATGNMRDWWAPEDAKNFADRAACIEKQFDAFVISGDVHENGKLVLGESIADLGGLVIAHAAFVKAQDGKPQVPVEGFTPEQRFFISYARGWCDAERPEFEKYLITVDPHPLSRFRAVGPLQNMAIFAAAFDCKAGDPMVRPEDQRCRIW
jgi:putative endopeptidase